MQKTLAPDKHEIHKIQRAFSSVYKIQGRGAVVGEITGIGLPLRAWPDWHSCKDGIVRLAGQRSVAIAAHTEGHGIVAVKGKILVADNCAIRYAGDEAFTVLMRDIRALCLGNAVHNMVHIAAVQIAGYGGRVQRYGIACNRMACGTVLFQMNNIKFCLKYTGKGIVQMMLHSLQILCGFREKGNNHPCVHHTVPQIKIAGVRGFF